MAESMRASLSFTRLMVACRSLRACAWKGAAAHAAAAASAASAPSSTHTHRPPAPTPCPGQRRPAAATHLVEAVACRLGQVQVARLVDEVKAGLARLAVVKQVHRCHSLRLAHQQRGASGHDAGQHLGVMGAPEGVVRA